MKHIEIISLHYLPKTTTFKVIPFGNLNFMFRDREGGESQGNILFNFTLEY